MNASRRVSYASNASLDELSSYLDDIPVSQSVISYNLTRTRSIELTFALERGLKLGASD